MDQSQNEQYASLSNNLSITIIDKTSNSGIFKFSTPEFSNFQII
jgi:hypothetical protein